MANWKISRSVIALSLLFASVATVHSAEIANLGLTFGQPADDEVGPGGTVFLTCGVSEDGQENICNPYQGDTLCSAPRPLLCFIDLDAPAPAYLESSRNWSSGLVAVTDAVPGDRFKTIGDADAYCAQNFGKDWRVASFHDGGGGWALSAYGSAGAPNGRVWVDIKNQSSGTCWSR